MLGPRIRIISLGLAEGGRGSSVGSSQAINSFLAAFYNSRTVLGPLAPILSGFHQNFTNCQGLIKENVNVKRNVFIFSFLGLLLKGVEPSCWFVHWATIFQEQTSAET